MGKVNLIGGLDDEQLKPTH